MKFKNVELKPCPICGGKAELKNKKVKGFSTLNKYVGRRYGVTEATSYVRCLKCHARTQRLPQVDNAINAWNEGIIYR